MAEPEPTPWGSGLLTAEQGFIWRPTNVPMTSGVVPECVCAAKGEASADPPAPAAECVISSVSANTGGKCKADLSAKGTAPALHAECRCLDKGKCGRGFEVMQKNPLGFFFFSSSSAWPFGPEKVG